jgi:hypothetical protein
MCGLCAGIVFAVLKKLSVPIRFIYKDHIGKTDAKQESPTFILLIIDLDNLNNYGYEQTITDTYKSTE